MFGGRGRAGRPAQIAAQAAPTFKTKPVSPVVQTVQRAPLARPEPDYEVVEFPSEQYVNAKLQPPPPPPPRPPTGHPVDAGNSCGLCGGGGARVRCTECGRRALCASCDDMYHRHPKRRHHQRQLLARDDRPPLPPKATAPVPPPRRHKVGSDRSSASPRPPSADPQRGPFLSTSNTAFPSPPVQNTYPILNRHGPGITTNPALKSIQSSAPHLGSMPYLPSTQMQQMNNIQTMPMQPSQPPNAFGHVSTWNRPRNSIPGSTTPANPLWAETWESPEHGCPPGTQNWNRPMRRGASVLELGGGAPCAGCANCAPMPWRYGSCASLDHPWLGGWQAPCCPTPHGPMIPTMHQHPHPHMHPSHTPQPYRRAESRTMSRAVSRVGSRAASPAMSVRSRTSRRSKFRSPSPPSLPSSDADSESDGEESRPKVVQQEKEDESSLGPPPPPPTKSWQCEHCTFVNEAGVRVCAVCCRTPTAEPKTVAATVTDDINRLRIKEDTPASNNSMTNNSKQLIKKKLRSEKEKSSTACGPSPPREIKNVSRGNSITKEQIRDKYQDNRFDQLKDVRDTSSSIQHSTRHSIGTGPSPPRETHQIGRASPYKDVGKSSQKHNVSVGPSPPREIEKISMSTGTSPNVSTSNLQKKSTGTSPPREVNNNRQSTPPNKRNVSTTGTSPPPQSISTQTYEVPKPWDRASSVSRARSRRRQRDDMRRERSHSRHSLSSDTRESERSARTSGGGRWEWRDSDGGEWSGGERRRTTGLTRRASHLDLRLAPPPRRSSFYGSEAPSPEPLAANRAMSLEALVNAGTRREAEKGLELARLLSEAERLGYSAAEVHAALAQNPAAPLAWLRERWPSLCEGVRAAAARLAPGLIVTELEARASLARHRGALWPAVTECVERYRKQADVINVGEEAKHRGRVWGSPVGVDVDAAPPRTSHRLRAEDSSDEFEEMTSPIQRDDWMYLPLEPRPIYSQDERPDVLWDPSTQFAEDIAHQLDSLLIEVDKGILGKKAELVPKVEKPPTEVEKQNVAVDFGQSENDFINAYNALTRLSPIPNKMLVIENDERVKTLLSKTDIVSNQNKNMLENLVISNHKLVSENNVLIPNESTIDISTKTLESPNKLKHHNEERQIKPNILNNANLSNLSVDEDKSNNLSVIVDNTQKLIQQMRDEIKSDINSLEDKNSLDSETENNGSSTDFSSEHESSYSDSEEQTNDVSSHASSSEDGDLASEQNVRNNNTAVITRTSSEENEQFEEALDHIEEQMEDFKKTNFEVLSSIAKSLQEEQIISVETLGHSENKISKQDLNNNFAQVLTFEEIYEVLGSDKNVKVSNTTNILQTQIQNTNINDVVRAKKQDVVIIPFRPRSPQKFEQKNVEAIFSNAVISQINPPTDEEDPENKNAENTNIKIQPAPERTNIDNKEEAKDMHFASFQETNVSINIDDVKNSEQAFNEEINSIPKEHPLEIKDSGNTKVNGQDDIEIQNSNTLINQVDTKDIKLNDIPQTNHENRQVSPLKTIVNRHVEQINKPNQKMNLNSPKSFIPKPIRTIQNIRQKIDKGVTKVIASKVPIRRNSLKQHPAPAPPKTHFGNVQSGHVKQLQTRLFNKTPKLNNNQNDLADEVTSPMPSTSTVKKKAPPPPTNIVSIEQKQEASAIDSPEKVKKKPFFTETCRTEDEWTESDSDDSQNQNKVKNTESTETHSVPRSPPPPITVRRVSGQIIDLASVRLPEGSPERQARMLLAEGATETWEQARLAVELVSRGAEPPSALLAALECTDLDSALAYLYQDCELCASRLPEHEMVSMLRCTHRCCRECAQHYFTVQITERSIADCVCPYCKEPELESLSEDEWLEYFAHLDILLKTLLEIEVHELFQRKLRDRTLARDPNFRWCVECSSGFFVHPKQKKIRCPECRSVSCPHCRKKWSANHEGLSCDQYALWLEDNDPERSVAAVQQHLRENGLECPRCRFKYSLSRGGCMHFTCTQCKYEFCYGCDKPFMMGARCGLSEYCAKLGLHAHHPRNCLFYLRDKEPRELQTLLQMNNVTYETEPPEGSSGRCPIQLQRETPTGLVDGVCGHETPPSHAGLCKAHYVEYLAGLARSLDPIPIMELSELVAELRRRALPLPERGPWDSDPIYAGMCAEIVKEKIPLD